MKLKLVLPIALCCFYVTTQAQIGKGSVWLGGNIGYSKSKSDGSTGTEMRGVNVSPAFGIAIKENTVAGIDLSYSNMHSDIGDTVLQQRLETYGAGLFIRRYIPVINRLYIYAQARAGFENNRITSKSSSSVAPYHNEIEDKGWNARLNIYPGVSYVVNKKLQLEAGLNSLVSVQYSERKRTETPGDKAKETSFSAGINLDDLTQFHVGFRLLINNKG